MLVADKIKILIEDARGRQNNGDARQDKAEARDCQRKKKNKTKARDNQRRHVV